MARALALAILASGCSLGFEATRGDWRGRAEVGAHFASNDTFESEPHVEVQGFRGRFQAVGRRWGFGGSVGVSSFTVAPGASFEPVEYVAGYVIPELVFQVVSRLAFRAGAGPLYGSLDHGEGTEEHLASGGLAFVAADVVPFRGERYDAVLRVATAYMASRAIGGAGVSAPLLFLEGVFVFH